MISCESYQNTIPQSKDCDSSDCQNTTQTQAGAASEPITPENIEKIIEAGNDCDFEAMLVPLSAVISKADFQKVMLNKNLHYRLMKYFHRSFKQMAEESEEQQHRLIFTMSLMAEIARRNEKVKLPFTRKIVLAMLSFDCNHIKQSAYGQQIIKILAVLLQNLTKQGKAATKLGVQHQAKNGLLLLMGKADELSTLQILLRAIKNLITAADLHISAEELEEKGVMAAIRCSLGDFVCAKLKVHLCRMSCKRSEVQGKTIKDLIDSN